jgi:hypothetical protein
VTDAAQILAQFGNQDPQSTIRAAALENIELALAATMLEKESNGRNVWGHDPGSTGGVYVKGAQVTKSAYLAYRSLVQAGKIPRQGVGPAQCTSAGYQNTADQLGGCWDPVANMRSGFRGLGALVRSYGVQQGAQRYNGSGPAAEAYGRAFVARYNVWKSRLSGATVPPQPPEDDDMTDVQAKQLSDLAARIGKFDSLESDLRGDLHVKQLELDGIRDTLAALNSKVDNLVLALTNAQAGKTP